MKITEKTNMSITKMSREDLLNLLYEIIEKNDDVAIYLNNKYSKKNIDTEKYINRIEKCFSGKNMKIDDAIRVYFDLRKQTNDNNLLATVGLELFDKIIWWADLGNYSRQLASRITDVCDALCEDITKIEDGRKYQEDFEMIWTGASEFYYDDIAETFYMYFDERTDEE